MHTASPLWTEGETINAAYYCSTLHKLKEAVH